MRKIVPEANDSDIIIIRERGVNAKGYGHIAKRLLTDPTIDIGTKGCYAYLGSSAGSGEETYLRRARVLAELDIGLDAYNKYMQTLEQHDYINRSQSRTHKGTYGATIVEFIPAPAHLEDEITAAQKNETKPTMFSGTIYALGYGTMPRLVARDSRISIKARGLYAYHAVHADPNSKEAYPTLAQILADLDISHNTYKKYMRSLTDLGYITAQQTRTDGRFDATTIQINLYPGKVQTEKTNDAPQTKKPTTAETPPETKKTVTVNLTPQTKKPTTASVKKPTTVSSDTLFIQTKTNILLDRLIDRAREKMHYDILLRIYEFDITALGALQELVDALEYALETTNGRIQIGKDILTQQHVQDVLMQLTNEDVVAVLERYLARTDSIAKPDLYLRTALYNQIAQRLASEAIGACAD